MQHSCTLAISSASKVLGSNPYGDNSSPSSHKILGYNDTWEHWKLEKYFYFWQLLQQFVVVFGNRTHSLRTSQPLSGLTWPKISGAGRSRFVPSTCSRPSSPCSGLWCRFRRSCAPTSSTTRPSTARSFQRPTPSTLGKGRGLLSGDL